MAGNWVESRRKEAWAHGRALSDRLLTEYCDRYGLKIPPPPASIIDELLTEHLQVRLAFDPLPLDRFAETAMRDGEIWVTVNSDVAGIEGVKDAQGVQNVAKWHEAIHVVDHSDVLRDMSGQLLLDGFAPGPPIVCYRSGGATTKSVSQEEKGREFWAEEAGRAAAVSISALKRTAPFQELMELGRRSNGAVRAGWPLLYRSAEALFVNPTALKTQLSLEGYIAIEGGQVLVQPDMAGRFQ
jgi:hypothetical protein